MNSILFLIVSATFLSAAYAGLSAAPYVPIWKKDMKRAVKLADIKPGQKAYDLGCGDGVMIAEMAKSGAIAEGFEISILPYVISQIRILLLKLKNKNLKIKVSFKDFWNADLSEADLVYFYLLQNTNRKLRPKFEKELKDGAKILCYAWPIEGWEATAIDWPKGSLPVYLYTVKK